MAIHDEEVLSLALQNPAQRREAFSKIISLYQERLYWQIRKMVLVHEDADDVLQNTFLKAWRSLENFRGDSKLSTWLFRIAINESITFLNKQKQEREMMQEDNSDYLLDNLQADEYFDGNEVQQLLQEAILKLPEKQRLVFNMRYFDEMKYEQMSEILSTSVGALKASYHIAMKKVEEYLSQFV